MYTSLGMLALAGLFSVSAAPDSLSWRRVYSLAKEEGQRGGKPLAVVIGTGPGGYHGLSGEGKLSPATQRLLARGYVPLYVDAATPAGKKLAEAFGVGSGPGLVISDRTGELQAFRHSGSLTDSVLAEHLERFADPNHVVRTTEQVQNSRVSYYPEGNGSSSGTSQAPYSSQLIPSFGGGFGGGRSC
jgi:hypothetical protein